LLMLAAAACCCLLLLAAACCSCWATATLRWVVLITHSFAAAIGTAVLDWSREK
jgi:hypothetical protein